MSKPVFEVGEEVMTPYGKGEIYYRRMKLPDYAEVDVYCVLLHDKVAAMDRPPFPQYNGTVVPADKVTKL